MLLWLGWDIPRPLHIPWLGEQALVAEIVGRLKARQRLRGDTGQIRQSEHER